MEPLAARTSPALRDARARLNASERAYRDLTEKLLPVRPSESTREAIRAFADARVEVNDAARNLTARRSQRNTYAITLRRAREAWKLRLYGWLQAFNDAEEAQFTDRASYLPAGSESAHRAALEELKARTAAWISALMTHHDAIDEERVPSTVGELAPTALGWQRV
jgi:hypothetical protein